MTTPKHRPCTSALLAASALLIPPLHGETNAPPIAVLPTVIVEASRIKRTAEELPQSVTVITADQIKTSGAGDTVQALEKLGGLYFRKLSGNPAQTEVVMRGFSQNAHGRVLILVDGQRMNDPDMANPNWTRIPVEGIESRQGVEPTRGRTADKGS